MKTKKNSELYANYSSLQKVIQTFEFIQPNESHKIATIQELKQIRRESLKNLRFYNTAFQHKKTELTQLKSNARNNKKKIPIVINEIGDIVFCYRLALYTYSLAYYLEVRLSGNMDSNYINIVKKDIMKETTDYKNLVKHFQDEMSAFFAETKAYDISLVFDIFANFVGEGVRQVPTKSALSTMITDALGTLITDFMKSGSEAQKESARKEAIRQVNALLKQCYDYSPFTQLEIELTNYDRIVNHSKLELEHVDTI